MKIIKDLKSLKEPIESSVVTIGTFDGVHVGHQKVIKDVVDCAKKIGGKSVVLTFHSHPHKAIKGEDSSLLITSTDHKLSLMENLGVDICVLLHFNKDIISLSPEDFIEDILYEKLHVKYLFVGYNFLFGHNRSGDIKLLEHLKGEYDYDLKVIKPVIKNNITVSSTVIRKLISSGDLSLAAELLGREYSLYGTVVKGDSVGRILGYPTANIFPYNEVIPPSGVYAVRAVVSGVFYDGILNIGVRPTFKYSDDIKMTIETHIFDFGRDIYGEHLEMFFVHKLREELKFNSKDELIKQINKDEADARKILKKAKRVKYRAKKGRILYDQ